MIGPVTLDLLKAHILPFLQLLNLIALSRVSRQFHEITTLHVGELYTDHFGMFIFDKLYKEYLASDEIGQHFLKNKLGSMLALRITTIDGLCPDLDLIERFLFKPNFCLDTDIESLTTNADLICIILRHFKLNKVKLTSFLFENLPFAVLKPYLEQAGVSKEHFFKLICDCKDAKKLECLLPYLTEPSPALSKIFLDVIQLDEVDLDSICLACRLACDANSSAVARLVMKNMRLRNELLDLYFHLIRMRANTQLMIALYGLMPQDEETKRAIVLAIAHSDFDLLLYKAIRNLQGAGTYQLVESAIMHQCSEETVMELLQDPNMCHDTDLVYTAAFRGYSEDLLMALMNTRRVGMYRSSSSLGCLAPFSDEPKGLPTSITIHPEVLKRLLLGSEQAHFYEYFGPSVFTDDSFAPFLQWYSKEGYLMPELAKVLIVSDSIQRMPKSLMVLFEFMFANRIDYDVKGCAKRYRKVHAKRVGLFWSTKSAREILDLAPVNGRTFFSLALEFLIGRHPPEMQEST